MPTVTDYVSILAGNYLQPLATLVERLVAKPREGLPGIKANEYETDWSVSSILLAMVMFESWIGRVRIDLGATAPTPTRAPAFYDALRAQHVGLLDVTEAFVLRDVIAHNHIWNVAFEWDPQDGHRLLGLNHVEGGDNKFKAVADLSTGLSRTHNLHLMPGLIDRTDVKKILDLVVGAMTALCDAGLLMRQALTGHAIIGTKGQRVTLAEIAALI